MISLRISWLVIETVTAALVLALKVEALRHDRVKIDNVAFGARLGFMHSHVSLQIARLSELLAADCALVGPLAGVGSHMLAQGRCVTK